MAAGIFMRTVFPRGLTITLTAATAAWCLQKQTLADLRVLSLNGIASAGSLVRGTAMRLADIPSRSAHFGSNARGQKSQSLAQLSSAFEAIAGLQATSPSWTTWAGDFLQERHPGRAR